MIQPGLLDRRVTIEAADVRDDGYQRRADGWFVIGTVWARYMPMKGSERFEAAARGGVMPVAFQIRWSRLMATVTVGDRVRFEGSVFDITSVNEMGRREGIELMCSRSGRVDPDDGA